MKRIVATLTILIIFCLACEKTGSSDTFCFTCNIKNEIIVIDISSGSQEFVSANTNSSSVTKCDFTTEDAEKFEKEHFGYSSSTTNDIRTSTKTTCICKKQ